MIVFDKQKSSIIIGILITFFYTSFITNAAYTHKPNYITNIYASISNFINLEQTPDQIARNSEKIILNTK